MDSQPTPAIMSPTKRQHINRVMTANSVIKFIARYLHPVFRLLDGARCRELVINDEGLKVLEVQATSVLDNRVVIYFHGGAHVLLSPYTHRALLGRLSLQLQARVIAVDYRKAPENPFPAGLDDALEALRWVRLKHPDASVVVGGDSAGGNLTFALLLRLVELGFPQPSAAFGFSPWLLLGQRSADTAPPDLEKEYAAWDENVCWAADMYIDVNSRDNPLISPIRASCEAVSQFPPVLIHADKKEPLHVDAELMAALCKKAGVAFEFKMYSGCMHVFQGFPWMFPKEAQDSLDRLATFLDSHW